MKKGGRGEFSPRPPFLSRPVLFWSEADARRVAEQQGKGLSLLRPYGERPAGIGEKELIRLLQGQFTAAAEKCSAARKHNCHLGIAGTYQLRLSSQVEAGKGKIPDKRKVQR